MLENCIFIKNEFIQIYFKGIFRDSLQLFGDQANSYLAKHLLITGSVCRWFINVSAALFLKGAQNSPTVQKRQFIESLKYS